MENKHVGYLIVGIATLIAFIIFSFNQAMKEIVTTTCSHGTSCSMWGTIDLQTNISLGVMVFVALIGFYFIFFSDEKKHVVHHHKPKKINKENYQKDMAELGMDEKLILEKLLDAQGTIFQSDLVEQTKLTKVKVTRLLDRLEGQGLIERKRRGMTNVVVLKH